MSGTDPKRRTDDPEWFIADEQSSHFDSKRDILIDYTNWKGVRAERRVYPIALFWTSSEHHPEPQWVLNAFCRDRGAARDFALLDIHSMKPAPK